MKQLLRNSYGRKEHKEPMSSMRFLTVAFVLSTLISGGCPYFGGLRNPTTMTSKQSSAGGGGGGGGGGGERCFCKLRGNVDDCGCKIETIDDFNARFIRPKLSSLLKYSFFRYFKINMHKACPFWPDDGRCALKDCAVEECMESDVPVGLKGKIPSEADSKYRRKANEKRGGASSRENRVPFGPMPGPPLESKDASEDDGETMSCKEERNLSAVDSSLTAESEEAFKEWKEHDDKREYFCELDDEDSGLQYVDLLKNPERFTGYSGPSAHRIWNSIYQENCFKDDVSSYQNLLTQGAAQGPCLEKRVFYRAISGLHSSINTHLSAEYLLQGSPFDVASGVWGPNAAEFQRRFDPEMTEGWGPQWLRNLYFLYLLELRALAKVAPYLIHSENYFTGNKSEDEVVRREMRDLLETVQRFDGGHFDESSMFANKMEGLSLKDEFKQKFRNISRIMDCVGCDKCKLWGKIQITGLGTALRILFPPEDVEVFAAAFNTSSSSSSTSSAFSSLNHSKFSLQRSEVVALLNAFGRISSSIEYVHMFRDLLYS